MSRWVIRSAVIVLTPPLAGLILFAFFYSMTVAAVHALFGLFAVWALPLRFQYKTPIKTSVMILLLLAAFFTVPISSDAMNHHTDRLAHKIAVGGPTALGTGDRIGVYLLGLWTAGLGALLYPEVAKELFYLYLPSDGGVRNFTTDFAMASAKIRAPLRAFAHSLNDGDGADGNVVRLPQRRIAWASYAGTRTERRVALALNPCLLSAVARRVHGAWRISASAVVRVAFPPRNRVTLGQIGGRPLQIEEGLFWALQELGWLHPYSAAWSWEL